MTLHVKLETRSHRRLTWPVLGLALSLALSGCSATVDSTEPAAVTGDVDPAAAAALPESIKSAGIIRAASDIPYPPMEMYDVEQNITGFDHDLAAALGVKLGVRFELQKQSFATAIPSLQAGKNDVIMSGMNDTKERQGTLDFVDYFHAGFSILVLAGNPENITGVLDLCGKEVAVPKATVQADILRGYDEECTAAGPGPVIISELPGETEVQTAVRSGRAVAEVVDSAVAAYTAQTAGDGEMFEVVTDEANPNGYSPVYSGIGILKENSELSEAIRLALVATIADGTYAEILAKYDLTNYGLDEAGFNLGS
ncbi:ABC transporter substrate-binding protein [Cryobacterium levicorallinum]|uniref:ABC transporter substrate-binding protein n=1 Tax=Cryobacterium levicorallinum TaxID=995038 RepID=A0A1I2ZNH7_9MICO|nr:MULTISPECIES: ABC transporter substrate-binding protein [Cryobacterium]TFB89586.1 ABC transporter substrate-binding protein [Cryobacterium levicorallinum]GEP25931.1 ABC transporter substrate-binding protein [Cryobacterium levicorallinum]SFH39195.1 polar amino acid transport system substrate-binding protein [Cryobacterium levicorallinum]